MILATRSSLQGTVLRNRRRPARTSLAELVEENSAGNLLGDLPDGRRSDDVSVDTYHRTALL